MVKPHVFEVRAPHHRLQQRSRRGGCTVDEDSHPAPEQAHRIPRRHRALRPCGGLQIGGRDERHGGILSGRAAVSLHEAAPTAQRRITTGDRNAIARHRRMHYKPSPARLPMNHPQPNNPLHGITLEMMLRKLVDHFGWEEMGRIIDIRCFNFDPSIQSSLKFLRKTDWARKKVEDLYLNAIATREE